MEVQCYYKLMCHLATLKALLYRNFHLFCLIWGLCKNVLCGWLTSLSSLTWLLIIQKCLKVKKNKKNAMGQIQSFPLLPSVPSDVIFNGPAQLHRCFHFPWPIRPLLRLKMSEMCCWELHNVIPSRIGVICSTLAGATKGRGRKISINPICTNSWKEL